MSTESKTMFNRRVFLLILTGVVLASAGFIGDPQALLNNRRSRFNWSDGRIVGGNTADPGQFSHQISQRLFGIYHLCSGSIISNRWIVTAAQCTYGWPMDYLSIVAGAHHISADGYSYEISSIIVHHEYDDENLFNDISLIQVQRPFLLSDRVAIIGFGSAEPIGVGIAARASGWGSLELNGGSPEYLRFLDLTTLSNLDCESRQSTLSHLINDGTLCAFSLSVGQGMCYGDFGSPLMVNGELVGITSWVDPCAIGRPDGFTRVSYYFNWITEIISE